MRFASLVLSACMLTACGGGGGDSGGSGYVSTLLNGQVVSAATAFDSFFVGSNVAYRATDFALPSTGLPATGPNVIPSYFYDVAMSLPASPSVSTQSVIGAAPANLTTTLALPSSQPPGTYFFVDGGFYKQGSPATDEFSYSNGEVVETPISEDGKHRLTSISFAQINVNALTGLIVSVKDRAPGLLPDVISTNPALTKPGAVWGAGAAYSSVISRFKVDTYYVDSVDRPFRYSTTIAALVINNAVNGIPGTLTTIQGVPVFVTNSPLLGSGVPTYGVLYQLYGNVYSGVLVKAGASVTSSAGYNAPARASIKAALTF